MTKNKMRKKGEQFQFALAVIFLSIFVTLLAFMGEENKLTGYATAAESGNSNNAAAPQDLMEFNDVKSLETLAPGNYFIDSNGIVYWTDDSSSPATAKVKSADESQKNRQIYIDDEGNVGYLIH